MLSSPASTHLNHTARKNDFQSNYWFLREMPSPQLLPEVLIFEFTKQDDITNANQQPAILLF